LGITQVGLITSEAEVEEIGEEKEAETEGEYNVGPPFQSLRMFLLNNSWMYLLSIKSGTISKIYLKV
jgi:hypothetical protein